MEAFVLRQYLRTSAKKNQVGEQGRVVRCGRHICCILSLVLNVYLVTLNVYVIILNVCLVTSKVYIFTTKVYLVTSKVHIFTFKV